MKKTGLLSVIVGAVILAAGCSKCTQEKDAPAAPDALTTIMHRKSVRNYTADTLPAGVMDTLLRAAMAAPTGMDIRPWRFVVLTDKTQYDSIFAGNFNLYMYKLSAAVVIFCADTTVTRPPYDDPQGAPVTRPNDIWRDDMGACVENFLLAAEARGLGACWTACYPYPDRMSPIRKALQLPGEIVPYCIVPVGRPTGENPVKDKWNPDNIHYGKW